MPTNGEHAKVNAEALLGDGSLRYDTARGLSEGNSGDASALR